MKPSDLYLLPNLHVSLSFCSVSFSGPGTRTGTLSTSPVSTNFASTRFWMAPLRTPICPSFSSHPFLEKESRIEIYRYSFLFPLPWIERKLVYAYFVTYLNFANISILTRVSLRWRCAYCSEDHIQSRRLSFHLSCVCTNSHSHTYTFHFGSSSTSRFFFHYLW